MKNRKICLVVLTLLVLGAVALVFGRTRLERLRRNSPGVPKASFVGSQDKLPRSSKAPRNLSLQPEALRFSRLLGHRFAAEKLEQSTSTASLTISGEQKGIQAIRSQTEDGESVQIAVAGSATLFTWDGKQGSKSSEARASGNDRDLIERLVFDSPDQFVLAQLRGASYFTVARNVRAEESREKDATLWNVIRVDDPQPDETKRPLSRWRLYYFNVTTGLIDRIVSQVQGQRITATLTWTDVQGEKVPSQILWTLEGQVLMRYQLTNFAHADTKGAK